MPTDTIVDEIVNTQVVSALDPTYQKGVAPTLGNLSNIDPFGLINTAPISALGDYDFAGLPANKAADFLSKINLARDKDAPLRTMPGADVLDKDALTSAPLAHGIPPLQHSVWVGNPLSADIPKQKAFMDALAKNKRDNPSWNVVLWTDQPRDAVNSALPDSTLGKMRQWAADNGVIMANIDEVYAGNNKMSLNDICKLEQNKSGTGRAATSDIVRLEVLKRFGGMYVDGDKAIQVKLDVIAKDAHDKKIRLLVPATEVGTHTVVAGTTARELEAEKNGQVVIEVGGFSAGKALVGNAYQNCALCSEKDSIVTTQVMARIRSNYQQDRHELQNVVGGATSSVDSLDRAQRVEVIVRSGPSAVRDTVDPESLGLALMPPGAVNTYTGTTSWSQERAFTAQQKLDVFAGKMKDIEKPAVLQKRGTDAATEPPNLPALDTLGQPSRDRVAAAVRKGLTTLSYTVPNEMGRLDMNHLKPHLQGLTPDEQALAMHATLKTLAKPEFAGLAGQVKTLRLPKDVPVAKETLDLMSTGNLPHLKLDHYTVQDAALEGNMQFLRYAKDKGLLADLNTKASQKIDAGTFSDGTTSATKGGNYDVVQAAILGGNRDAIQYLASLNSFKNYQNIDGALLDAAKLGHVDTVISLGEALNRPEAIQALGTALPPAMWPEVITQSEAIHGKDATLKAGSGTFLKIAASKKDQVLLGALDTAGFKTDLCTQAEKMAIGEAVLKTATLDTQIDGALALAKQLGVEDQALIAAAQEEKPSLITASLNLTRNPTDKIPLGTFDPGAQLAMAHMKFPDSEVGKNDYKNVSVDDLKPSEARALVQKALVYSHDRLRADSTGDSGRVKGWTKLMNEIKAEPKFASLIPLADQAEHQLGGMNAKKSVRAQFQQEAKAHAAPDLSQRTVTSVGGKLRALSKPNPTQAKSPADHTFVPGKGMTKMS